MKGKQFVINFFTDRAYLARDISFDVNSQTNIQDTYLSFNKPAHWLVRVLNYDVAKQLIYCEVLRYNTGEGVFPDEQNVYLNQFKLLRRINFRSIDTNGLLTTRMGATGSWTIKPTKESVDYTTSLYEDHKEREEVSNIQPTEYSALLPEGRGIVETDAITKPEPPQPFVQTIKETIQVTINELQFTDGGVTFKRRLKSLDDIIEFTIFNQEIKKEFDAIKNYFSNALGKKLISVEIEVEITDEAITNAKAISKDIDLINKALIDTIKFEVIKKFTKKLDFETEKALFTMDELFDSLTDSAINSSLFYEKDTDLFEDILKITDTKHYRNLRLLSSKHAHEILKLRFVLKPFSFVFLVKGEMHFHLVWETLDTEEATYIWHIEKDKDKLKAFVKKIDEIINEIKNSGKKVYIKNSEDNYDRIFHDYSDMDAGFKKWKSEIERVLI